nr:hypothetical protein [Tanacetum cinerariifolium]
HLKSGSRNLDFHLANHRGQSTRVTLWGGLGDLFYLQPVPRNKVYLSSTSSTVIYDDDAIPAIKALKKANRYRLEVDVSDNTAQVVVVMFNETATALVNCSADSLMDTVDKILPSKGIDDSVGSSNLDDYADNQPQKMKSLRPNLMDVKDSETEDSSDSANAKGKKGVVEPSAKKRKNDLFSSDSSTDF